MRRVRLAVQVSVAIVVLALAASPGAHAQTPPSVTGAKLTQQGQDLVWWVRLARPLSPASLARAHSSVCLLVERRSGALRATVCVVPGRHRKPPPLLVVGHRTIASTVTRPASDSLTASFLPSAIGMRYTRLRWQVCIEHAGTCASPVPARAPTVKLHVPRLVGCVASGPDFVFHGPTDVHDIALTFDDGPWGQPPSIDFVRELARLHVPGTFFEIGDQIGTYDRDGSAERAMLAGGDMIGDHTWTHPSMTGLSPGAQRSQIALTAASIKRATGFQVCLFRAPYGSVDRELLGLVRSMGMTTIQWNDDPRDWSTPGVGAIEGTAISEASNGGIVELHFGGGPRYETLDALPDIVSTLRARGYEFVTVTQMLGYRLIYK
jgi:peptidoglycan/xylan/chitin deacetylase (PgdA/CDA1 family)